MNSSIQVCRLMGVSGVNDYGVIFGVIYYLIYWLWVTENLILNFLVYFCAVDYCCGWVLDCESVEFFD